MRAATCTGVEPETDSLYEYMHDAFAEMKHVNPDYLVSNRRGRVKTKAAGYGSASTVSASSSGFETTSNDEDIDSSTVTPFRVPKHKGKGRGKCVKFISGQIKFDIYNNTSGNCVSTTNVNQYTVTVPINIMLHKYV